MAEVVTPATPEPNAAEVQQAIDQVASTAALADPKVPIEVKLKTGQVYRGLPNEVLNTLVHSQEEASRTIKQQKDELARVQQELQQVRQAQQQAAQPPVREDVYDANTYYEKFQKDPLEAQQYLDRFDPTKQAIHQTLENLNRKAELERFQNTVGFYPNDAERAAFANEFVASKLEPNAANYELVYWRMANTGKISAKPVTGVDAFAPPPPVLRSSAAAAPSAQPFDIGQFESLPPDQQAQVIQRLKSQGWK